MTTTTAAPIDLAALGAHAVAIAGGRGPGAMTGDVSTDVRRLFVDTVGALAGGLHYPAVRNLARELGQGEFGRIVTLGSAATWLDADSGGSFHPHGDRLPPVPTAHPAPHVLPVLLEHAAGHNDATLLRVFAAGTELGLRLGAASSLRPGLHPHGIHGPAGAAVARALLAGADADGVARAFVAGGALPLAATLAVPVGGGTVRNLWTGLGSYYGAQAGADPVAVSIGEQASGIETLLALFDGAVCDELDPEVLMGTDQPWRIRDSYLKPYACARWIHPALDAFRIATTDRAGELSASIEAIDVRTFAFAASLDGTAPTTDMAARFSLPFSLATLAVDGRLTAREFLPDRLARPEVVELAGRVRMVEEPAYTAALPAERPTEVRVRFADGEETAASVRNARGNPNDPLSRGELEAKLRANVGDLIPAPALDELAGWLDGEPGPNRLLATVAQSLLRTLA